MEYNIFGCLLFGLISGFSEFLPVSTLAHQYIFGYLTGFSGNTPYIRMTVYLGCLAAVLLCCRKRIVHIYRELRLASLPKRRRRRLPDMQAVSDFKLTVIGLIPMVVGIFFYNASVSVFSNLPFVCLMLIVSGILSYLPQYMASGFRNSKNLTPLDGILLGACSALAVIPGVSRMGLALFAGKARRCGRESILELAFLIFIPMLFLLVIFHMIQLFAATGFVMTAAALFAGFVSALASFGGAMAAIYLIRYLIFSADVQGFSFYCWGLAVFCFVYYLLT